MPSPVPFLLPGGQPGVLLIHGFTGSPAEMRRRGDFLHARGLTVSAPLLPGHGATPADLNRVRRQAWIAHVEAALADLQARCERVFVAGLSLGSLLALTLAEGRHDLPGVIACSPAVLVADPRARLLGLLKYLTPAVPQPPAYFADPSALSLMWCYDVYPTAAAHETIKLSGEVKRRLPEVTCPLLVIYSRRDSTIHPQSAQLVYDRVSSTDKELIALERSGHVITMDSEWEQVAEACYLFIRQRGL